MEEVDSIVLQSINPLGCINDTLLCLDNLLEQQIKYRTHCKSSEKEHVGRSGILLNLRKAYNKIPHVGMSSKNLKERGHSFIFIMCKEGYRISLHSTYIESCF